MENVGKRTFKTVMSYFNQFKNATRETKRLLVLLALMFGFSALAATHKVSEIAVDPSTLDDGAQVVNSIQRLWV